MSIFTTLRSIPTRMVEMLTEKGFMRELSEEDRVDMESSVAAFTEELFGATVAVADKPKKEKKTKAAVVSAVTPTIDREYLQTLTIQDLKQLGKDCPTIKGRKPRAELIEIVLAHFNKSDVPEPEAPAPEDAETASDEELREEAPPAPPAPPEPKKKEKKPAEKKEKKEPKKKAEKKEKEKKPAEKKEKKAEEEADTPESDDEETVSLREWFHPSEVSKPREQRRKYYIDPKTNELYDPDRLQAGQAEWVWNEETNEITPV
jgi:hypothetical protein